MRKSTAAETCFEHDESYLTKLLAQQAAFGMVPIPAVYQCGACRKWHLRAAQINPFGRKCNKEVSDVGTVTEG